MNDSTLDAVPDTLEARTEASRPVPQRSVSELILLALRAAASLRVTVVLFVLAFVLVFVGTLAQMDAGIQTVVAEYFRSFFVWVPFQSFVRLGQVFLGLSDKLSVPGAFPFPGGWTLGALLMLNLLAAHAVRFQLTARRLGILILHSGLILMMVGELITGLYAVEGRMTIEEGKSSNYVERSTEVVELALVDSSDLEADRVVVIPMRLLETGGRLEHPALPFDVEPHGWMKNSSEPRPLTPADVRIATAGAGTKVTVDPRPVNAATAAGERVDVPSLYVTLYRKNDFQPFATYLVSLWLTLLDIPQHVELDGKSYSLALRWQRIYKPYTMHLKEFRHDVYEGTTIAKNFSSLVRLEDPNRNEDREFLIYMNQPLRHAGETFYQAGFLKDGQRGTILQVVRNPGWLLPYVSCVLVTLGMLLHFGQHLTQFLRTRAAR